MQQAGREKKKESYSFRTHNVHSQGFYMLPEQITAAEVITAIPKQFTSYEPSQ